MHSCNSIYLKKKNQGVFLNSLKVYKIVTRKVEIASKRGLPGLEDIVLL